MHYSIQRPISRAGNRQDVDRGGRIGRLVLGAARPESVVRFHSE